MIYLSPLTIHKNVKKKVALNLNIYRNAHYHTLNKMKANYKAHMKDQIKSGPIYYKPVRILYTLFPKDRRLCDLDNVLAIHAKFFQDALVEFGAIPEDNYTVVVRSAQLFGAVDKHNPRVEIDVKEIDARIVKLM